MSHFKQKLLLPINSFSRAIMCLICFFNNLSKKTKQKKTKHVTFFFFLTFPLFSFLLNKIGQMRKTLICQSVNLS